MKRSLLLFGLLLSMGLSLKAQDYKTAVGLRLGYPMALTLKNFFNENMAAEVYVGSRGYTYSVRWVSLSGALLYHKPLENELVDNLNYYFGAGASVFAWRYGTLYQNIGRDNIYNNTSFGVQGYLGLEYTFDDTPLSISVDWVPSVFLGNGYFNGFGGAYGNLAVRYVLR